MPSLKCTVVIKIRKNLSNFQAMQAIQGNYDPCNFSLWYLEDVLTLNRYDIVQTTFPSICSFLILSYNTKYGLLILFSIFFFSLLLLLLLSFGVILTYQFFYIFQLFSLFFLIFILPSVLLPFESYSFCS